MIKLIGLRPTPTTLREERHALRRVERAPQHLHDRRRGTRLSDCRGGDSRRQTAEEASAMVENVFVLGLDAHNAHILHGLPDADRYRFHPLLADGELAGGESVDLPGLLDAAQRQVEAFGGPVHAVIGFWDFPVSTMVPVLCERLGLRWASIDAVVKCEHKYWSRLVQAKVIDEVPGFGLLDLANPELPDGLHYPVWVKPVRSASSELAFRADDPQQLTEAAATIGRGIRRIGDAFGSVLDLLDLPPELARIGGSACLVEEAATGRQVTVEGYSHEGDVHVYGIVDSITVPDGTSFLRYQYPSTIPDVVAERMTELTRRVITQIGYDGVTFNVEFFWDAERDTLVLLEINPRHSQSHAELFAWVDGVANHHHMVELALGRAPRPPHRQGPHATAAKWFVRRSTDGVVRRVPTPEEIARVERDVEACVVEVTIEPGERLSERHDQDSYSYAIANVYVGGASEDELTRKFEQAVAALPIEIEDVDANPEEPTA
jgi:biotin carboxylase